MTWIAIIILTLVVVMAIVRPLLRPATDHVEGGDLALYRDQLAELDRDVLRGLISAEEAKSARFELEKRLLKAAKDGKGPATWQVEKPLAWLLAVVVAGGSWMLYDWRGSPMLPDFPLLARQVGTALPGQSSQPASTRDHAENPQASMAEAAERLAQKLALKPDDFDGWALLGRTYLTLNRASDAALAYREAVRLNPTNPEVQAGLGEALTFANNGQVSELAKKAFELAYSFDPKNSASLYYLGMANAQSGQIEKAVDYWQKLAAQTEPGASWAVELREKLTQAANQLGKNPADLIPANLVAAADASAVPPAAAIPGPTPEQMAAAQDMDPEARNQMIQGMVQRLADKLAANPNDAEGWQRLSRAYAVLGQSEKAAEAQSNALKYGASAGAGNGAPSNPNIKGPTAEQMAAASQMSEADQRAMIDGMVKKLETRLQQQPGDFEGWVRLGQSYRVLGRSEDARKAWEKAKALKPNDPAVNNLLKQLGNG